MNTEKIQSLRRQLGPNFCPVPFTTIILEPNGNIGVCRIHGRYDSTIGNISQGSITEIWNGEAAREWRRQFLENDIKICDPNVFDRRCNLTEPWNELLPEAQLTEYQTAPILKLTANLNGRCNMRCQMCTVWQMPNGLYTEELFWKPARREIFPTLREVDMLAGEPFFQEDTFRLMDEIHAVNPACRWNVTSNLHWPDRKRVARYIERLRFKEITVSLDSLIPEVFHKIRYPGRLAVFLETLEYLISVRDSLTEPFLLTLNFTLQKDNWREARAVIEFCRRKRIFDHLSVLRAPEEFSVLGYGEEARVEMLRFYLDEFPDRGISQLYRVYMTIAGSLPPPVKAEFLLAYQERLRTPARELESPAGPC